MRRIVLVGIVALAATACSLGSATSNVGTADTAATKACSDLRQLAHDRPGLSPREVLDRVGQINADAQASANPVIQARAVALYTDAESVAEGADPSSMSADLAAMKQACLGH